MVRITRDVPAQEVREGMVGAVVEIFAGPPRTYEVHFFDIGGYTLLTATLGEEDVELLASEVRRP